MLKQKLVDGVVKQYLPLIIGAVAGAVGTWLAAGWPVVYAAFCRGHL